MSTARALLARVAADCERVATLGRAAPSARALLEALQRQPVATASALCKATGLTPATVNKALVLLEQLRVVEEATARQRGRVFAYREYIALLNAGLDGLGVEPAPAAPSRRPMSRRPQPRS